MRAIIVSAHPALALALSSQMPGLEARSASSPSTVGELVGDDGLVVLDLGSTRETADWLDQIRGLGVDNGIVIVDAPSVQAEGLITHLSRPFSVADLAAVFETTIGAQTEQRRTGSELAVIVDVDAGRIEAERGSVSSDVPPPAPLVTAAAQAPPPPPLERPADPQRARRSSAPTRRRRTLAADALGRSGSVPADDRGPDPDLPVTRGLAAAETLEQLLADLSTVGSVARCGAALLEELSAAMPVGSSAVAMRGRAGDLELVAAGGQVVGVHVDHLAVDHPFVRAVERRGGALLLSPTDDARGFLAGVPASHWPVLLAATITSEERLDGIVLIGREEPAEPADLDRFYGIVQRSGDLLRLAASIRRLPRPDGAYQDYLHSWMR